jgi:hypothetical protein
VLVHHRPGKLLSEPKRTGDLCLRQGDSLAAWIGSNRIASNPITALELLSFPGKQRAEKRPGFPITLQGRLPGRRSLPRRSSQAQAGPRSQRQRGKRLGIGQQLENLKAAGIESLTSLSGRDRQR